MLWLYVVSSPKSSDIDLSAKYEISKFCISLVKGSIFSSGKYLEKSRVPALNWLIVSMKTSRSHYLAASFV